MEHHLSNNFKYKTILHIGIGNSYFANNFYKDSKITGITISQKEIDKAKSYNLSNYDFFLCDKYSKEFNTFTNKNKFDLVVDNNLKSYSCCQESFEFMMDNIIESMNDNGMLITSINGMKWFKKLWKKYSKWLCKDLYKIHGTQYDHFFLLL